MLRQSVAVATGIVSLGMLAMACQADSDDATGPADTAAVVGVIARTWSDNVRVLIEDPELEPPSQVRYDAIFVLVDDNTELWVKDAGGSFSPTTREELAVGNLIRAYYSGIMLRSLPPAVEASRVEITRPE